MSVRLPDELIDEYAAQIEAALRPSYRTARSQLDWLVSDLRDARAEIKRLTDERDEQTRSALFHAGWVAEAKAEIERLQEALEEAHRTKEPSP